MNYLAFRKNEISNHISKLKREITEIEKIESELLGSRWQRRGILERYASELSLNEILLLLVTNSAGPSIFEVANAGEVKVVTSKEVYFIASWFAENAELFTSDPREQRELWEHALRYQLFEVVEEKLSDEDFDSLDSGSPDTKEQIFYILTMLAYANRSLNWQDSVSSELQPRKLRDLESNPNENYRSLLRSGLISDPVTFPLDYGCYVAFLGFMPLKGSFLTKEGEVLYQTAAFEFKRFLLEPETSPLNAPRKRETHSWELKIRDSFILFDAMKSLFENLLPIMNDVVGRMSRKK